MRIALLLLAAAALAALTGCAGTKQERQLQRVARDWSMVIRASQVMPVYPLTEDLVPGDVFLVQSSIEEQAAQFRSRGFLPLDQFVTRLDNIDFDKFYEGAYWDGTFAETPHPRNTALDGNALLRAPRAAFPSYAFAVESGQGLALALPIQGVPVGLSLMGAQSATGTVTISDAFTYGADSLELYSKLFSWSTNPEVRTQLAELSHRAARPLYFRVVNRVYLTQRVVVSLVNTDSAAAGGDAGVPRSAVPPDLLEPQPGDGGFATAEAASRNYGQAMEALSDAVNTALPGGSVRFATASARAVTLSERFPQPLAIGYIGFDVPILEGGRLGAPLPTYSLLTDATIPRPVAAGRVEPEQRERTWMFLALDGMLAHPSQREAVMRMTAQIAAGLPGKAFNAIAADAAKLADALATPDPGRQATAEELEQRAESLLRALQTQATAFVAQGPHEARSQLVRELVNEAYDTYVKRARRSRD